MQAYNRQFKCGCKFSIDKDGKLHSLLCHRHQSAIDESRELTTNVMQMIRDRHDTWLPNYRR